MTLGPIQAAASLLEANKDAVQIAKDAVTTAGAVGGWGYAWYLKRQAKRVNLVLDSKDGFAVLFNQSSTAIEVTNCTVELFDVTQPIGLGKSQSYICSPRGLVKPGEEVRLVELKSFEATIEKWLKTEVAGCRNSGLEMPRMVGFRIFLSYRRADTGKTERARFARHLGGHPVWGWGLTYSPYHGQSRLWRDIKRKLEFCKSFLRSPRSALKQREGMKYLQRHLSVMSTLRAVQDNILTSEQAELRLEKILNKKGDDLTQEVVGIIESQRAGSDSFRKLPPDSASPSPQP